MTRRTDIPSKARVRAALTRLHEKATETGKRPTVLALAREFGLSNTTFRRHFPDVARDIAEAARTSTPTAVTPPSHYDLLVARNAKLKRRKRELTAHLTLAAARIQQVTLDNQRLKQQLEAATSVTRIGTHGRRPQAH
ncbi:hypothetical protein ABZ568_26130 [Streptomyces olindensis]|uniref:TetR family transcriptional regulator n=1 Tax=Streptomyces olindensis TaxID=358823 RepID=A0ABV2Y0S9_9ACTN